MHDELDNILKTKDRTSGFACRFTDCGSDTLVGSYYCGMHDSDHRAPKRRQKRRDKG